MQADGLTRRYSHGSAPFIPYKTAVTHQWQPSCMLSRTLLGSYSASLRFTAVPDVVQHWVWVSRGFSRF
eukprot:7097423-Prymnesium_polylepis.2